MMEWASRLWCLALLAVLFTNNVLCGLHKVHISGNSEDERVAREHARREARQVTCDVVIAGGSTAALAAALTSASEGAHTCLIEPTNWPGGQLAAEGLPAPDFAFHTLKEGTFVLPVYEIDRNQSNITPNFYKILSYLKDPGQCWVSPHCFEIQDFLGQVNILINEVKDKLDIYYNTVVHLASMEPSISGSRKITSLWAIQRTVKSGVACDGYDVRASKDLPDWYSPTDSDRWSKQVLEFIAPVYVEATAWGEVLALTNATYLQGIDERFDGDVSGQGGSTQCGQAFTYNFAETYSKDPVKEPPNPTVPPHPEFYSFQDDTWQKIWTYRRIKSASNSLDAAAGDVTVQDWGGGNDYPYRYLFLNKSEAAKSVGEDQWQGGIDLMALDEAERHALGWHYFFKNHTFDSNHTSLYDHIVLNSTQMGTCHGLSKLPYIRDSRRSVGINDFVIKISDISGNATQMVGVPFSDRLAIGCYDDDIHKTLNCTYPTYIQHFQDYQILPYFLPFRAMTSKDVSNLVVAGLSMAQSFLTNAATRLHPVEWSGGSGAGVAASYMSLNKLASTTDALAAIQKIQARAVLYTPINWSIWDKVYPPQA